ncbi:hypothetical protein HDU67_009730 [Dinochytrium kinnereticum]|nr:hypothetical protein HDU67_009730 [Dinochytrium kinnereticum]
MVAHYTVPRPPHAAVDAISFSSSDDDGSDFMEVDDETVARPAALPQVSNPGQEQEAPICGIVCGRKTFSWEDQASSQESDPPRATSDGIELPKEHALDRQANKNRMLDKSSSSRLPTDTSPIDVIEPLRRKIPSPAPNPTVLIEEVSGAR